MPLTEEEKRKIEEEERYRDEQKTKQTVQTTTPDLANLAKEPLKTQAGSVLSWTFGIVFLLAGIGGLIELDLAGFFLIICAGILLPPVIGYLEQQFKILADAKAKIVVFIINLLLFFLLS